MEVRKDFPIRNKRNQGAIFLFTFGEFCISNGNTTFVFNQFCFAITKRLCLKISRECIYCFRSDAIQTNSFFKNLGIVFCTGIYFADTFVHFTQRHAPAEISDANFLFVYSNFDGFSMTHYILINRVVNYLFDEHINTIIMRTAIAQFTNVHARSHPDMFFPV